jgi:carbamoyltransferase
MTILGINCGHDASICLIQNGVVICAIEEEKISRQKSEIGFPLKALQYIIKKHDLKSQTIDVIAIPDVPYYFKSRLELQYRFTKKKVFRRLEQLRRFATYFHLLPNISLENNRFYFENLVRKQIGSPETKIIYYNHHLAHAASAYYTAPFKADLCITCDGRGEEAAFNFYLPNKNNDDLVLTRMNGHETSVGQVYSAVTTFLGFKANRHEGKIMGLAATGKPTALVEDFNALFFYKNAQLHRLPNKDKFVALSLRNKISFKTAIIGMGRDYALNTAWLNNWLTEKTKGFDPADIAYALQKMTEDVVLAEIQSFLCQYKTVLPSIVKIALAGGVFANVRLNQLLFELPEVENIFIQPAMSDAGLSLGAAILAERSYSPNFKYAFNDSYIGAAFFDDIPHFINQIASEFIVQHLADAPSVIADLLAKDTIVGFYNGQMEWGPRALGNRSIIANPFRKEINNELNRRLNRTEFMPFAPSVLDSVADEYLENYDPHCPASDYMTMTYALKKKYHTPLQAIVHVDGTCRPHIVHEAINPYYHAVLQAFYEKTGYGAIVNTSFNVHEEPIVATPYQALRALKDKRIDVLIVENYLISLK